METSKENKNKSKGKGTFVVFVIFLLLLTTGCASRFVIYKNAQPEIQNTSIQQCASGLQFTTAFVRYHEIKEGRDSVYWPEGLELEDKVAFRENNKPLELQLKVANGHGRKITIVYREEIRRGNRLISDKTVPVYKGKLPYRNYTIALPKKGGDRVEAWFEIDSKYQELPCLTGRAVYYVIPKDKPMER